MIHFFLNPILCNMSSKAHVIGLYYYVCKSLPLLTL